MADKPDRRSLDEEVNRLRSELALAWKQIHLMQQRGGFADAKTLSKRCGRIEERLDKLERAADRAVLAIDALLASAHLMSSSLADHLAERHQVNILASAELDVHSMRQARAKLRTYASQIAELDRPKKAPAVPA